MFAAGPMPFEVLNSIPEDQRPTKPALFIEDSFDGKMQGDAWMQIGPKFGYEIALREAIPMGAKDLTSQVLKAKTAGVDAIVTLANLPELVTLYRQMKENNFSVKFFQGLKGTWPAGFWEALGKDAEGVLLDGFWSMDSGFPGAKELGERYYKDYGQYSVSVGFYYALPQILFKAIEIAGTLDDAKVRQAVLDNEFMAANGPVDYDEKGVAFFPLKNFQWRNGRQIIIYPPELTKEKVQLIVPWDKR